MTSSPGRGKAFRFDDSLRIKLKNGHRSEYSPRFKSSCVSSQKLSLCLVSRLYCCHRAASLISSCSEPGNGEAPPTLETSLQHVALFINCGGCKMSRRKRERGREREATMVLREAVNQQETFWVGWTDRRSPSRGGFSKMFKQSSLLCNRLVVTRCTRTMSCTLCDVTAGTLNTHK